MKKAILAALVFIVVGFALVDGTLASTFNAALDIFADLTATLGQSLGLAATDASFDVDLVTVGDAQQLYPGGKAATTVRVDNMGELPACFRLAFAVQKTSSWGQLECTFTVPEGFTGENNWREITVGGTPYYMAVFTYNEMLAVGGKSPEVSITIAMAKDVTTAQINEYRADFLKTQVLAIDATPFLTTKDSGTPLYTSAAAALDAALPLSDTFNPFK